jgi:diguanylate cyclase (GGDEF)-like protein
LPVPLSLEARGRILVVDDVLENVQELHRILKDEHEVLFALDGDKALEIARTQRPDLILLEAAMAGPDGYAVCDLLQRDTATCGIPIISIAAAGSAEEEARALESGAVDVLHRPLSPAVVRARVRTHLSLRHHAEQVHRLSLTDALTGVANRRAFDEAVEREWRRGQRSGRALSLIVADLDSFKVYNERHGHLAGDDCLRTVAKAMAGCVGRPADMVARYGGEEFAVVLPDTELEAAAAIGERMAAEVVRLAVPHGGSLVAPVLTLSIGVACCVPTARMEPERLIVAAESALFQAKDQGRNQVVARALAQTAAAADQFETS